VVLLAGTALALIPAAITASPAPASAPYLRLITPRAHQIVQRTDNGVGTFSITGVVRGRGAVKARWNGGPWVTVDEHPSGGRFSGRLTGLPAGQGTLVVRLAGHRGVGDVRHSVGVGDLFVVAGQSNACGRAPVLQKWRSGEFTPSLFGNDGRWKVLADPVDSPAGQLDTISRDRPTRAGGSVWPLLATKVMARERVPVAFIPVPYSGSSIADWQCREDWPDDPATLYGNMLRRVAKAGGMVRSVLFWQGEWDAGSQQVDGAAYGRDLHTLAEAVQRDLGTRLVVCQIGEIRWRQSTPPPAPALDGIRIAQSDSWQLEELVAPGPPLYDILLHTAAEDRVHYRTPRQLSLVTSRWWCALAAACYGRGDGRGPRLTGAASEAGTITVRLTFADDALPLALPKGDVAASFTVRDSAGAVPVSAVRQAGPGVLSLELARPLSGSATVSLGEGHLGAVNPVPHDSGPWRLPAELFLDRPVLITSSMDIGSVPPTFATALM
jgi:hypothetical protein